MCSTIKCFWVLHFITGSLKNKSVTRAVRKSVLKSVREALVGAQPAVCPRGAAPGSAQASTKLELEQSQLRKHNHGLTWHFISLLHALAGPHDLHFL